MARILKIRGTDGSWIEAPALQGVPGVWSDYPILRQEVPNDPGK